MVEPGHYFAALAEGRIRNVSVGRKNPEGTWRDRPIYTLYAPQSLANLQEVETRLRRALEDAHLHATLTGLH